MSEKILVGSARHDEFGGIGYGNQVKPGDQTGHECETQEWYKHELGWVAIVAKSEAARDKIAQDMEYICANPCIGYSQPHDQSLYKVAKPLGFNCSLVTTDCETDCAKAVRVCCLFAGIDCPDFYTGNELSVLNSTGAFDIYTEPQYCDSPDYNPRGTIYVTRQQGHTVVQLTDGKYAHTQASYTTSGNVWQRTGPGTEYPTIQVVPVNTPFNVLSYAEADDGGTWAQGEYKGKFGYVSCKYLRPAVTMPQLVTTGNLNLRAKASLLGRIEGVIPKGATVRATGATTKVLGTTWHEVIYNGKKGWASGKYLC